MTKQPFQLSRNYVKNRPTKLGLLILVAVALDLVAGVGLSYVAGFGRVNDVFRHFSWQWVPGIAGALAVSFVGYYLAYRDVYSAQGGPKLRPSQLRAVVAAGFGGFFAHGGAALDQYALEGAGADERDAKVRVAALGGFEHGSLGVLAMVAAIITFIMGRTMPGLDFRIPWAAIPVPGFLLAFYLAARYKDRFRDSNGLRAKLSVFIDSILLLKHFYTNLRSHGLCVFGMILFWAADMFAIWLALAGFGVRMNGASLVLGVATGAVFTRRTGPFAGAGVLMVCIPLCLWTSGCPLAVAVAGVFAFRVLSVWVPMPVALAALPTLRRLGSETRPGANDTASSTQGEPALR